MNPADFSSRVAVFEAHSDKLSHSLANLGVWLDLATLIVAIGLVLETVEIAEFIGSQVKRRQRRKGVEWCKGLIHFGAILVLAGVSGEFVMQFRAAKIDSQRYEDERHVATLRTEEATDAEGKIATLQKNTADVEQNAAQANERAKSSEAQAAASAERAATLEIQAAQAEKDAADAKAAQARLQAKVVWRRLSADQCSLIMSALPTGTHGEIGLQYVDGDPESESLAIDIANCLGAPANGLRIGLAADSWGGVVPFGVTVAGDPTPLLSQLQQGFTQAGLNHADDDKLLVERRSHCSGACRLLPTRITVGSRPVRN